MIQLEVGNGQCDVMVRGNSQTVARDFLSAILAVYSGLNEHDREQAEAFKAAILKGLLYPENWAQKIRNGTATYIPKPETGRQRT